MQDNNSYCLSAGLLRPLCSARGAIAPMITFLLILACFTAVTIANISQLMLEKTRLQNVADASALAAATVQSLGLNEIADLNYEIDDQYGKLVQILRRGDPWFPGEAERAIRFFQFGFNYLQWLQDKDNWRYAHWAWNACLETIDANTPENRRGKWSPHIEMTPRGQIAHLSVPAREVVHFKWLSLHSPKHYPPYLTTSWSDIKAGSFYRYGSHDGSFQWPNVVYGYKVSDLGFVTLGRRKNREITTVGVELVQQPADFAMGVRIFGQMPELRAYAMAKPTGGSIGGLAPFYRPMLIR